MGIVFPKSVQQTPNMTPAPPQKKKNKLIVKQTSKLGTNAAISEVIWTHSSNKTLGHGTMKFIPKLLNMDEIKSEMQ